MHMRYEQKSADVLQDASSQFVLIPGTGIIGVTYSCLYTLHPEWGDIWKSKDEPMR